MLLRTKEFVPGTAMTVLALLLGLCRTGLAQAPANDNFADATPLYGSSVTFTGTLDNSSLEVDPGEDICACQFRCYPGASVWWSWTATNTTAVVLEVVQQTGCRDVAFGVHLGTSTTNITTLDCNILDSLPHRYVAFSATAGVTYYFRVMGTFDSPSSFTLQLTAANVPKILSPPASQTLGGNASAVFTAIAGGLRPLKYQWQFQGNNLPGETAPALIVHRVRPAQEGGYSVVVSNVSGVTTSTVANLTLSGTNALPTLTALNVPNTNRFFFTLTGEAGKVYQIDRASSPTAFIHWPVYWPEDETNWPPDYLGVVNATATSTVAVDRDQSRQFFRPSLHPEICLAHLKVIDATIKLMALEQKQEMTASVTEAQLFPYLNTNESFVCPSGGTCFCDSYSITTVTWRPTCMKFPGLHLLP